jgi:hypothetical protein
VGATGTAAVLRGYYGLGGAAPADQAALAVALGLSGSRVGQLLREGVAALLGGPAAPVAAGPPRAPAQKSEGNASPVPAVPARVAGAYA